MQISQAHMRVKYLTGAGCEMIPFGDREIFLLAPECEMKFAHICKLHFMHISHAEGVFHLPVKANFVEKSTLLRAFSGTPGATRTHYIPLRRRTLYPGEVRGRIKLQP